MAALCGSCACRGSGDELTDPFVVEDGRRTVGGNEHRNAASYNEGLGVIDAHTIPADKLNQIGLEGRALLKRANRRLEMLSSHATNYIQRRESTHD